MSGGRNTVRVKVCCISSVDEARRAVGMGANALGLVSEMPSGPGVIREADIATIADSVPPPIATFLLTSRTDAADIVEQQRRCRTNTIQICDRVDSEVHIALRKSLPGVSLVQVIHVNDAESVREAVEVSARVDALLLDSGNQSLAVKELGGTGRTHDWSLSRQIVEEAAAPVFLAGGLKAENVGEAIKAVAPFGVDLCSGVRTDDRLDEVKLQRFMQAVADAS